MGFVRTVICVFFIYFAGRSADGSCYFQQEFQGEYVMQSAVIGPNVQYATLKINATTVGIWGHCHKRIGNNYLLRMSHGETSCIRCFHLKLRSSNVLEMITSQNSVSKCHIVSEEQAENTCPTEQSLRSGNVTEILLFKTKDVHEMQTTRKYCPLDGKYSVIYRNRNVRSSKKIECLGLDSTIDSCPSGSTLNIRLKGCNEGEISEFKFECLGSWNGMRQENFIIFVDSRQHKPRYRCAVYEREQRTGRIYMALSNDSTCNTDLHNATSGFETFLLQPKPATPWPVDIRSSTCNFPDWMQGKWEQIRVNKDTLVYQDHSSFKTYTIKCAASHQSENKYLVFSRSQCNEEHYSCLWVHKRSSNILEFQISTKSSHLNHNLCHESYFLDDAWITQGRTVPITTGDVPRMCPIAGEYTGVIPDSESELCANLRSDCNTEVMYYQVSSCVTGELYEEREYVCLGHWVEGDLLYTYTKRMDVAAGTYECFVGSITPKQEVYIKEAGTFCQRDIDPIKNGMQLIKNDVVTCHEKMPVFNVTEESPRISFEQTTSRRTTEATTTTVRLTKSTRKPWNFDNNMADVPENKEKHNNANISKIMVLLYICTISLLYHL
ncbi:uncharacterized protein LOC123686367 [Harmonia axyridis]|uniref:uncharacterized protein LOC123686367 n=1 Tax=Harmonia axyridis TaxID=115357 RepID=UPI001E2768D1|nr:uncharacterized protein LOC123686367 [Harmonia axyridis]XP_045482395.1 uncharacterized protein LOC123686367 [Harmonia axyridis]